MHRTSFYEPADDKRPARWDDAIAPRTGLHVGIAVIKLGISFFVISLFTYGIALVVVLVLALVDVLRHRRKAAKIEGSCVRVTPQQFPEIHALVLRAADRVELKYEPDVYIAHFGEINAVANKLGRSRQIILSSEIISGAAKTKDPGVLEFIIAHEMAHLYFGHANGFRTFLKLCHKRLSRLDELTADRAAASLVADKMSCLRAIALLTIGPELIAKVDLNLLAQQASWVPLNKHTLKAERQETHPLLLHRMAKLIEFFDEEQASHSLYNPRAHHQRTAA